MLIKNEHYKLRVKNPENNNACESVCIWDGDDFYPLKAIPIIDPYIPAKERIDNRLHILSIEEI